MIRGTEHLNFQLHERSLWIIPHSEKMGVKEFIVSGLTWKPQLYILGNGFVLLQNADGTFKIRYPYLEQIRDASFAWYIRRGLQDEYDSAQRMFDENLPVVAGRLLKTVPRSSLLPTEWGLFTRLDIPDILSDLDNSALVNILMRDDVGVAILRQKGLYQPVDKSVNNLRRQEQIKASEAQVIAFPTDNTKIKDPSGAVLKPAEIYAAGLRLLQTGWIELRELGFNISVQQRRAIEQAVERNSGAKGLLKDPSVCEDIYAKLLVLSSDSITAANNFQPGSTAIIDAFAGLPQELIKKVLSPGIKVVILGPTKKS